MDDRTTIDRQLCFTVLPMMDTKEVLPQIKIVVDPEVSFTQGNEGCEMQEP
jgi:hypothetical protein